MSDPRPFFLKMLEALLEAPEDLGMDQIRAQMILDGAGEDAVLSAIENGDAYASALWLFANGYTRDQIRTQIEDRVAA